MKHLKLFESFDEFETDGQGDINSTENIGFMDPTNLSRTQLLQLSDEQIEDLGFEFTRQIVDRALDRDPIDTEILDKFYKNHKYKNSSNESIHLKRFLNFYVG